MPSTVVAVETVSTSTSMRGRSTQRAEGGDVLAQRPLVARTARDVAEDPGSSASSASCS